MEDKVTPFPHVVARNSVPEHAPGSLPFAQTEQYQKVLSAAHEHLLNSIEDERIDIDSWAPDTIARWVEVQTVSFIQEWRIPINEEEMQVVAEGLVKELTGFGPLDDLLHDPTIEDILINGFKDVHVSQGGQLKRAPQRFTDDTHLLRILRRIIAPLGRRLDDSNPMVDARLPNGGRLNAIISPLAVDGPMVSIRKFRKDPFTPDELLAKGTFDAPMQALLKAMVLGRCNILVSGGTSSGKTSLLNALASYVPANERVITVEDTAELSLNHPHVVRLESRIGGAEGQGAVSIRDLVRNSLRMRPDRIVVGEVRGAEVLEMLQAMNTGHDGSMATI
ncbi:CpaF family protein, partial [Stenotrophomonas lactitubi]